MGAWIETKKFIKKKPPTQSHPVWVRGLKHAQREVCPSVCIVAPRVGAWIETKTKKARAIDVVRRTPCGCVD